MQMQETLCLLDVIISMKPKQRKNQAINFFNKYLTSYPSTSIHSLRAFSNCHRLTVLFQGPSGSQKLDGFASAGSNKLPQSSHHKSVSKRNASTTGVPPFPIRLPYHQPPMTPVGRTVVPSHHLLVHEYTYHTYPRPFPTVEPHLVKPGCEAPVQPFIIPGHGRGRGIDANRAFQPPQLDSNAYNGNFPNGRHTVQEPGSRFNYAWRSQRVFNPRDNVNMQQPRAFIRPPQPFFGPAPGFINGPSFPGNFLN